MNRVAVVLAGCGVYDGAEVNEAVLTLLCLEQQGASYECFAPDIQQMHVINHLTGEPVEGESRNVLVEAARIARGNIRDLGGKKPQQFCRGGLCDGSAARLSAAGARIPPERQADRINLYCPGDGGGDLW